MKRNENEATCRMSFIHFVSSVVAPVDAFEKKVDN